VVPSGEDAASPRTEQGSAPERDAQVDLIVWTLAVLVELEGDVERESET
jgi:hypothetical protein